VPLSVVDLYSAEPWRISTALCVTLLAKNSILTRLLKFFFSPSPHVPSLPSLFLSSLEVSPPPFLKQLESLGKRCKLPQRGPGRSPNRKRICCTLKAVRKPLVAIVFSILKWMYYKIIPRLRRWRGVVGCWGGVLTPPSSPRVRPWSREESGCSCQSYIVYVVRSGSSWNSNCLCSGSVWRSKLSTGKSSWLLYSRSVLHILRGFPNVFLSVGVHLKVNKHLTSFRW